MNSVESPSASLCSDGNSPTLTPPSSSANPPPPARPPPHSLWSKSVEGSESECLIWSSQMWSRRFWSRWIWSCWIWSHRVWSRWIWSCRMIIVWSDHLMAASRKRGLTISLPQISTSNSVFRNIFGRAPKCFRKYFRPPYLDTQFLFADSYWRYYTRQMCSIWTWQFFWLFSPDTGLAMEQSLQFHTYKIYFNPRYWSLISWRCYLWRWHWRQYWKGIFVRLETSGKVRLCDGISYNIQYKYISYNFTI